MLMRKETSCLLIVDVQERLAPVVTDPRRVIHGCAMLQRVALRLEIPQIVSEQYPKGIGPTVADLREGLPPEGAIAKTTFSCLDEPAIVARLAALGRRQVVIAGIEAHICVLQTAIALQAEGYEVFVVKDASASRRTESEAAAWARLALENIAVVTLEMVVFEWLKSAGTPEFRELVGLIK